MSRTASKTIAAPISILTANRLADGTAVFLDFEGAWNEDITEAVVARSPDEVTALEDRGVFDAARNIVVDPYLVEVRLANGRLTPVRVRERVRVGGPTVLDDVPGYVAPAASLPRRGEAQADAAHSAKGGERNAGELLVEAA
jgi:hypothetical protein